MSNELFMPPDGAMQFLITKSVGGPDTVSGSMVGEVVWVTPLPAEKRADDQCLCPVKYAIVFESIPEPAKSTLRAYGISKCSACACIGEIIE